MRIQSINAASGLRLAVILPTLVAAAFTGTALADDQYIDSARVLSVTPQTESVNVPRQECRTEYQQQSYSSQNNSIMGAVIGGVAGGLLGNTVGRGSGRVAAAAIGAGVGAIAGDRLSRNNTVTTRTVPVETCYQVDNWQTVNAGHLVTYEYNGRTYNTVTSVDPGDFIDVNVIVAPNSRVVSQINYIEPGYGGNPRWNSGRAHGKHHKNYRNQHRYY